MIVKMRHSGCRAALALVLGAAAAPPLLAQTAAPPAAPAPADYPPPEEAQPAPDVAPVAVTPLPTGSPLPVDRLARPVTVLTADDVNRIGGADITRVLALVPGLTWERYGAAGAYTNVHMRGAGGGDTLVLIDGVRMQDIAAIGGGFDFGTLTGVGIDHIEVLRGSNSVVWGSGAVGGVIAIDTPETKGINASFELGSRDTLAESIAVGIRKDRYALSLNTGYTATDDIPRANDDAPGGFHQWRFGGRGRYNLTDTLTLTLAARYADDKATGNAFPLPYELAGYTGQALENEQTSGRAAAHFEQGAITLDGGYGFALTRDLYVASNAAGTVTDSWLGKSQRADLAAAVRLGHDITLNLGGDDEWTGASGDFPGEHRAHDASAHVLLGWYAQVATLAGGFRIDDTSAFGTHDSVTLDGSLRLVGALRARASYAQGFRAPSLYQLYSGFGNAALQPEVADSYEAGLDYLAAEGTLKLGASLYRRDTRDLVQFVTCTGSADPACAARPNGTFENVRQSRADGLELEAVYAPTFRFRFTGHYSHDLATNRTPGAATFGHDLTLRPRDVATLSTDWTSPFKGLVLGADLRVQSGSWGDLANTQRLPAGQIATLRASLPFGNFLDFYGRIENLFNDHQPTVPGYGAPGRGVFAGIRVRY